ncbi:MAG: diacylglycerol kinase, partial [Actinomycetota bacterium]|nr:diacylglycerol kinase [Actinomycetota bacterium]
AAVQIGLHGARKKLDVGVVNGEHFAVMAGAGFDALMIRDADRGLKDRAGRLAYVFTGAKNLRASRTRVKIRVDGKRWFDGKASCVLVGNVGKILGGVTAFENARPDDGRLELGVVTADGIWQWTRALARTASGNADRSPFVQTVSGRTFDVRLRSAVPYELDGGDRPAAKRLKIAVEPDAITVCVPDETAQ